MNFRQKKIVPYKEPYLRNGVHQRFMCQNTIKKYEKTEMCVREKNRVTPDLYYSSSLKPTRHDPLFSASATLCTSEQRSKPF